MAKQVGVDIGSTMVRVVEVRGLDARGYAVVSRVGYAPMREGAIVGGRIRNAVAVSQALIRALKQAGVAPYGFVASYAAPEAAVGRMMLPSALKGDERIKALRTMDRQVSASLRLDDSTISLNEIRRFNTGDGVSMTAVVVAAAAREEVEQLKQVFKLAKCAPRALDLAGAANMRALVRTIPDGAEVHTVVDIGATKTSIATRQGPHLRSLRQIATGGGSFTRAIMGVTGDNRAEAEARQKIISLVDRPIAEAVSLGVGYGSATISAEEQELTKQTMLDEAVSRTADDLVEQIASSIENDASNYGNSFTQGVVLSGATAQIPGLRERLSQRLGVPVQLGRPWATLEKNRSNLLYLRDGQEDPKMMMDLTTAIGLALWSNG
jgi:type IV pilus assembly protein PilM